MTIARLTARTMLARTLLPNQTTPRPTLQTPIKRKTQQNTPLLKKQQKILAIYQRLRTRRAHSKPKNQLRHQSPFSKTWNRQKIDTRLLRSRKMNFNLVEGCCVEAFRELLFSHVGLTGWTKIILFLLFFCWKKYFSVENTPVTSLILFQYIIIHLVLLWLLAC